MKVATSLGMQVCVGEGWEVWGVSRWACRYGSALWYVCVDSCLWGGVPGAADAPPLQPERRVFSGWRCIPSLGSQCLIKVYAFPWFAVPDCA